MVENNVVGIGKATTIPLMFNLLNIGPKKFSSGRSILDFIISCGPDSVRSEVLLNGPCTKNEEVNKVERT